MTPYKRAARLEAIDTLLAQLRSAMQGGHLPCIPSRLTTRAEQRTYIQRHADRLTLCFAVSTPQADAAALRACRLRLRAALTFLLFQCNPSDRTYESLINLWELDSDTLSRLFARTRNTPRSFRRAYRQAPTTDAPLCGGLELAVALHLEQEGTLPTEGQCRTAVKGALAALAA